MKHVFSTSVIVMIRTAIIRSALLAAVVTLSACSKDKPTDQPDENTSTDSGSMTTPDIPSAEPTDTIGDDGGDDIELTILVSPPLAMVPEATNNTDADSDADADTEDNNSELTIVISPPIAIGQEPADNTGAGEGSNQDSSDQNSTELTLVIQPPLPVGTAGITFRGQHRRGEDQQRLSTDPQQQESRATLSSGL